MTQETCTGWRGIVDESDIERHWRAVMVQRGHD